MYYNLLKYLLYPDSTIIYKIKQLKYIVKTLQADKYKQQKKTALSMGGLKNLNNIIVNKNRVPRHAVQAEKLILSSLLCPSIFEQFTKNKKAPQMRCIKFKGVTE